MARFGLRTELKWLAIIAIVAFAVYAQTLNGSFVYDDNRQVVRNPLIQQPALFSKALTSDVWAFKGDGSQVASNYWRPTFTAWCIANYGIFGLNPLGWHLSNVILNILVCCLAFLVLRRLDIAGLAAFGIALVFTVHPVHSESVAWIAGSPDLLFGLFFLASLWFAEDWRDEARSGVSLGLSIALYILALGAKESAFFCFPVYFFVFWHGNMAAKSAVVRTVGFAAAAAVYFLMRMWVIGGVSRPVEDAPGATAGLLSIPGVFVFYLGQIVFPWTIGQNYPLRPAAGFSEAILPLIISVAAGVLIWFVVRRHETARIAASIMILPLVPVLYVGSFPADQIVHDRYLYLPLLGSVTLLYFVLRTFFERFALRIPAATMFAAVVVITCALAAKTVQSNAVWANDLSLWSHSVTVDPESAANWIQLGSELSLRNRHSDALAAYEKALSIKQSPLALMGRGRALLALGRYDDAISDLSRVAATPNEGINAYTLYQSYEAYALALQKKPDLERAGAELRAARARLPIYSAALTEKLAVILYLQGRKDEALRELEGAVDQARREMLPESRSVFLRTGMLYSEMGRKDEAKRALNEYLQTTAGLEDKITLDGRRSARELLERIK